MLITTQGDTDQLTPLSSFGETGVFVKEIEEKLLSGEADLAVHSLKVVPASGNSGFQSTHNNQNEFQSEFGRRCGGYLAEWGKCYLCIN